MQLYIGTLGLIPYYYLSHTTQGKCVYTCAGADAGFQVRGGGLKKIAPSGGRLEKFRGISCQKSRFYAKRSYFFQL
jgi:hypothetical protein